MACTGENPAYAPGTGRQGVCAPDEVEVCVQAEPCGADSCGMDEACHIYRPPAFQVLICTPIPPDYGPPDGFLPIRQGF